MLVACVAWPAQGQDSSSAAARGQYSDSVASIRGVVLAVDEGRGVPYATVTVFPGAVTRFADSLGGFTIPRLTSGPYLVRARQIGFASFDTTVSVPAGAPPVRLTLRLRRIAVRLPPVAIIGHGAPQCMTTGIPDSAADPALAAVFGAVRINADRYHALLEQYPFVYTLERWRIQRSSDGAEHTVELDTTTYDSRARRRYRPGTMVYFEGDRSGRVERRVNIPSFFDLADSLFQAKHCFVYAGEDSSAGLPQIRIDFRPAASIQYPDVEGSVYLDASRYMLRRTVFQLTAPERVFPPLIGLTVTTTFREIVPSIIVFDEMRAVQPLADGEMVAAVELDRLLHYQFTKRRPGT